MIIYAKSNHSKANVSRRKYKILMRQDCFIYIKKPAGCGWKLSKGRLTILYCVNMAGQKEKLLVVGQSARPRSNEHLKIMRKTYRNTYDDWFCMWNPFIKKNLPLKNLFSDTPFIK